MTVEPGVAIIAVVLVSGLVKLFRGPVGEVDAMRTRLAEVEERLDFAERLLARKESTDQLPGGVQR